MTATNSPPSVDPADYGSLIGTLKHFLMKYTQNLDDMLPAQVINYNRDTNMAQVQPLIPFVTTENQLVSRAQLVIPVKQPGAGGYIISYPVTTGTLGWIKSNDRDISIFQQTKQASAPNTQRKHSFEDAVFEPDNMNVGVTISEGEDGNLVIQNLAGTVKISVSQTGIGINGPSNPNAALDVQSTTKAFIFPRMTATEKNAIPDPIPGMAVFDTTANALSVYNGAWS